MEVAEVLRTLWSRKLSVLLVVVLAVGAGTAIRLNSHTAASGTASAQLLVDSPQSAMANLKQDTIPLTTRASVLAQAMTSTAVLQAIANATGFPVNQITAEGPYSGPGQALDVVTPAEARGSQIRAEKKRYRLTFLAQQTLPLITVTAQAPTATAAAKLANGVYPGTTSWIASIQANGLTPPQERVTIRQLGPAAAATVNSGSSAIASAAAVVGVLILGCLAIIGLEGMRRRGRELSGLERDFTTELDQPLEPRADVSETAGGGFPRSPTAAA